MADAGWEERVAAAWATFDERTDEENRALVETLAAELPDGSAEASFERACVFDSTAAPELAVPLYREALAAGLGPERRRRAVIQLASSLRNLGRAEESVALLTDELAAAPDELDDAVRAFLALALTDVGRAAEAVAQALTALAPHLPRYQRSLAAYAEDLAHDSR
jgi:tetratricopeptide (TPR) repeat protein